MSAKEQKNILPIHNSNYKSLRFFCIIISLFLIYLFSCYFPFVMEYYVSRPSEGFFEYLLLHFIMSNDYTHYEMIILFLMFISIFSLSDD